jgi:hypothetical protein
MRLARIKRRRVPLELESRRRISDLFETTHRIVGWIGQVAIRLLLPMILQRLGNPSWPRDGLPICGTLNGQQKTDADGPIHPAFSNRKTFNGIAPPSKMKV